MPEYTISTVSELEALCILRPDLIINIKFKDIIYFLKPDFLEKQKKFTYKDEEDKIYTIEYIYNGPERKIMLKDYPVAISFNKTKLVKFVGIILPEDSNIEEVSI